MKVSVSISREVSECTPFPALSDFEKRVASINVCDLASWVNSQACFPGFIQLGTWIKLYSTMCSVITTSSDWDTRIPQKWPYANCGDECRSWRIEQIDLSY